MPKEAFKEVDAGTIVTLEPLLCWNHCYESASQLDFPFVSVAEVAKTFANFKLRPNLLASFTPRELSCDSLLVDFFLTASDAIQIGPHRTLVAHFERVGDQGVADRNL